MNQPRENLRPLPFLCCAWALAFALGLVHSEQIYSEVELVSEDSTTGLLVHHMARPFRTLGEASGISRISTLLGRGREWLYGEPILLGSVTARDALIFPSDEVATDLPFVAGANRGSSAGGWSPILDLPQPRLASHPRKILLLGSSSIQYALGRALERRLEAYPGVEVFRFGRFSSGLARPDYFDWMWKAKELVAEFEPDLAIAQIGGNDCQSLTDREGKLAARFGTEEWDEGYSARIEEFAAVLGSRGARVVLLGMPIMRSSGFSRRIAHANRVTEDTGKRIHALYFSVWEATQGADGRYRHTVEEAGREKTLRSSDGIHLSGFGAELVSEKIATFLEKEFGIG